MIECVWMGEIYDEQGEPVPGPLNDGNGWEVGWCFYMGYSLSNHYKENVASLRKPITVILPMRGRTGWKTPEGLYPVNFCIDSHPTSKPEGAWTVEVDLETLVVGYRPDITVAPSIDCRGLYHGFVQHGLITDDIG